MQRSRSSSTGPQPSRTARGPGRSTVEPVRSGHPRSAEPADLGQVRGHRRQRPRVATAARSRRADGRAFAKQFKYHVRAHDRRQHLRRPGDGRGLPARSSRSRISELLDEGVQVLCRRSATTTIRGRCTTRRSTWTGERYYTFAPPEDPADAPGDQRRVLRPRLDQSGSRADAMARRAARRVGCGLEDLLLPSSAVHVGPVSPTSAALTVGARAALHRGTASTRCSPGHEHIYQRSRLQNGIQYFVIGRRRLAAARRCARRRRSSRAPTTTDYHFMLVEIDDDVLHFQAISRTGETVDAGRCYRAHVRSRGRRRTRRTVGDLRATWP